YGIASMRDVGEGSAVNQCRIILDRLHQVGRKGVLEQGGHRAPCLELRSLDILAVAGLAHNDVSEAPLQIVDILRKTEHGHDFRRGNDVESVFPRIAVPYATKSNVDFPERTIVHIDRAAP